MYGEIIWQLIRESLSDFLRKLQHSNWMLKVTKRISNVHFSFTSSGHTWSRLTVRYYTHTDWMKAIYHNSLWKHRKFSEHLFKTFFPNYHKVIACYTHESLGELETIVKPFLILLNFHLCYHNFMETHKVNNSFMEGLSFPCFPWIPSTNKLLWK